MPVTMTALRRCSVARRTPLGGDYASLPADAVADLSRRFQQPAREIEIAALQEGIVPERYCRNLQSFALEDQAALLNARVVVVGLGGLGGTVTEILARTGVGRLRLVDGDRFDDSNLNRQLLSSMSRRGQAKALAAAEHVAAINPSVTAQAIPSRLTADNARELVLDADVVVDCLDNLPTRFELETACRGSGCPLVSAAIAGHSGHITTVLPGDPGLARIFGPPGAQRPPGAEKQLGNLAATVNIVAALECSQVVKLILKHPGILRNRLLVVDLTDYTFDTVSLE
jgi:molybdopterin/thiamine biosynthesis adenylyltransferase